LKGLRARFERFCYRNRNKGIPNLMLYISIASAIVYVMGIFDGENTLYNILCFDRNLILQGQIWRLITYAFTFNGGNILWTVVGLICFYSLGRAMENIWGTCRFNLFYFTGMILMDAYAMIFDGWADISYLNMSLLLGYATLFPDARFMILFIIPVKAWILALIDIAITLYNVFLLTALGLFPISLFPLVAIANYFLFFGKDVLNIIPISWQANFRRLFRRKSGTAKNSGTIPFPTAGSYQATTATVK